MSTFLGKFEEEELKDIAADYFRLEVHHCTAFFLSHCHTDHMHGLNSSFGNFLKENPSKKIYCSLITKELFSKLNLSNDFDLNTIVVLNIDKPNLLLINETYINVTLIPAGHCPGSVMFLFEVNDIRVLFTGDFRFDKNDIHKLKQLNNNNGTVKLIHNLYLDTTFAFNEYKEFPTREQSLQAILNEIDKWLKKDTDNVVNLELPARFGYEFVYVSINTMFNIKVHVSDAKIKYYSNIHDINQSITNDESSRIHSCFRSPCISSKKFLTVRLCAKMFNESFIEFNGGGLYKSNDFCIVKICYSNHCSLNELKYFVKHLSPLKVTPFVIWENTGSTEEIISERVSNFDLKDIIPKIEQVSNLKKRIKLDFDPVEPLFRGTNTVTDAASSCLDGGGKVSSLVEKYVAEQS